MVQLIFLFEFVMVIIFLLFFSFHSQQISLRLLFDQQAEKKTQTISNEGTKKKGVRGQEEPKEQVDGRVEGSGSVLARRGGGWESSSCGGE